MQRIATLPSFLMRYQKANLIGAWSFYLIVVTLGSIPGARMEVAQFGSGWILHLLTYSFITCLLFSGTTGNVNRKACIAILSIAVMGALDEFIQYFFPYRSAAFTDWLIDLSASIFTSAVLFSIWPVAPNEARIDDTTALDMD